MGEELVGVRWVSRLKGNGRTGAFAGKIGAGALVGDLVGNARGGHVLPMLPAGMVGVAIAELATENFRLGMGPDEVVSDPPDGGEGVAQLALVTQLALELHHAPREKR